MGEILVVAIGWLAALALALGASLLGHDLIAAAALAAAIAATVAIRALMRRTYDAPPSSLVDGIEAIGVAAVGVTLAAASSDPLAILAAVAIAFAAVTQQYAALVHAHITRRDAFVGAPLGFTALGGFIAYLVLGRPALLLAALGAWALIDCVWSAIVRGHAIASADRLLVRPPRLPPLAGRARWLRLGEGLAAARDTAFWGLVVARPIARMILQLVVEQRWLTPNRVTVASLVCCFGAAGVIAAGGSVALAIVLIGIRSVLDSMDGQLARYRACGSSFGSYLDKVSDLFAWGALLAALGVRAYAHAPEPAMLLLPCIGAILLATCGFALWLSRALTRSSSPPSPPAQLGVAAWARSLWRIVLFEEPDFYLWIALALATARYDLFVPFIAGGYAARALVVTVHRASGWLAPGKESPA